MAGILRIWLFIAVIIMPFMLQFSGTGRPGVMMASAEDEILPDVVDMDEDLDATIENDEGPGPEDVPSGVTEPVVTDTAETEKDEEEEDKPLKPSPDADTHILFIRPSGTDFPAGQLVKFLVGFSNKGDKDFVVETMDAAFRYPQDYSFYIQNFTTYRYYRTVEPNREATFEYAFTPGESFSARSFGLTINLNYRDLEGNMFQDAVFNTTVSVIEPDEGLDGETFFLYVFLIAVVVLLIVGAQQLLTSYGRKRMSLKPKQASQQPVEMGTQNNKTDVDYSWLPDEMLQDLKRSPKTKTSPRQRTAKRRSGTGDD